MSQETYNIKHDHLSGRVETLEIARVNDRKEIKGVGVAVGVALTVPILTNLTAILDALGGTT